MNKRIATVVLVATLVLAADQATKIWARSALKNNPAISLIDNYLFLGYYENEGVAFSLGNTIPYRRVILVAVGLAVLLLVWRTVRKLERRQRIANIAFAAVAGGALGNIIDRLWQGSVVDFIVMHWRHRYYWPAYNIADIALCVGVGLLLLAIGATSPEKATPSAEGHKRGAKRGSRRRHRAS